MVIKYYSRTNNVNGFTVSVIEGKDVFRDAACTSIFTLALPNSFVIIHLAGKKNFVHQTKVASKGSSPLFSETFYLYLDILL